jgi:hypothetical protein
MFDCTLLEGTGGLQEEFARGDQLSQKIVDGNGPPDWNSLLEACPFFQLYKNYLQVRSSSLLQPTPLEYLHVQAFSVHSCKARAPIMHIYEPE